MNFWGIKLEKYREKEILEKCQKHLAAKHAPLFIATVNPEILLETRKDFQYKDMINKADLKVIDGFGIKLISWLKRSPVGARITGVNLAEFLLQKAKNLELKIGIIYNQDGWSSPKEIKKSCEQIKKVSFLAIKRKNWKKTNLKKLKDCHLLLVALGHPYQEKLIHDNLFKFPSLKIAIGIGGTLDYWTGKKKRAPRIIQKIGLEWMWRLFFQPNRICRIFKAIIVFPLLALLTKNK